ncbi:MAG: MFS transporter [Phycisphaerales bacterium]
MTTIAPNENLDHRRALNAAIPLLAIASLPDAMVVPVLKGLLVDRYSVSVGAAHWFLGVNILGGALAAIAMRRLGARAGGRSSIAIACLVNAAMLAAMAFPVGFGPTLLLRFFEGGADLFVFAALFHVVSQSGPADRRGRRLGCAATCMMLGIATGVGVGGGVGAVEPTLALWVGAGACLVGALVARLSLPQQTLQPPSPRGDAPVPPRGPLWPAMAMHAADRGVGGLLATTLPLGLGVSLGYGPAATGLIVGVAMLGLALGVWPAGQVADRLGWRRVRIWSAAAHLAAMALLVPGASIGLAPATALAGLLGLAGAGLFASSLTLIGRHGPGAMGAYHAAGSAGFLALPLVAALGLTLAGGALPGAGALAWAIGVAAAMHGLVSVASLLGARDAVVRARSALSHG